MRRLHIPPRCVPASWSSRLVRWLILSVCWATHAAATTVVPPEFPALVNDSDYIVHAVTRSVTADKRTDARGTRIYTRVELEVVEVVAGTPPAMIVLEMLGGRVGDEVMTVEGMPRFRVGDEDVLFVSGNGRSICPLYGMMHGRYPVETDSTTGRRHITRSDGMPLSDPAQVASPIGDAAIATTANARVAAAGALNPADFIRQIKAAVRPGAHITRAK